MQPFVISKIPARIPPTREKCNFEKTKLSKKVHRTLKKIINPPTISTVDILCSTEFKKHLLKGSFSLEILLTLIIFLLLSVFNIKDSINADM